MENRNHNTGITFLGLLQIVFIVLKLLDKIDWPWWAVLLPMWGPIVLFIGGAILVAFVVALVASIQSVYRRHHTKRYK